MYYIGIDLGSTNMKVAVYTQEMKLVDRQSCPVNYIRENGFVEFDAKEYVNNLIKLLSEIISLTCIKSVYAIVSFNIIFVPINCPTISACCQTTPINQANIANIFPTKTFIERFVRSIPIAEKFK